MSDKSTEQPADVRTAALKSLRRKREFKDHVITYITVNSVLIAIWLITAVLWDAWFPWPIFPLAGWGIGLALHAWSTFGPTSKPITEEDIEREVKHLTDH